MNQAIGAWSSHGGFVFWQWRKDGCSLVRRPPRRKRGRRPGRKPGDREGCAASGMALAIGNNRQRHAALATVLHMVLKMLMFAAANTRFRAQRASSSEGRPARPPAQVGPCPHGPEARLRLTRRARRVPGFGAEAPLHVVTQNLFCVTTCVSC